MKKILIDTNAYVAFKKNVPLIIDIFRRTEFIGLNDKISDILKKEAEKDSKEFEKNIAVFELIDENIW